MNHFISGILKIVLLEASVALLLLDLASSGRFSRTRARAAGLLALLMVYAWSNYGALRHDARVGFVLTAVPLVLACAWLVQAGFGATRSPAMDRFRGWAAGLHPARGPRATAAVLAAALAVGWVAAGVQSGAARLVHPWEQFHFYFGAKYQRELGWFNLYKAAILADRETVNALGGATQTRDLTTFDEVPIPLALLDAAQVRARFSDPAWEAFKADWATYARTFPVDWPRAITDHGNSNSPAWSILAHPLARLVPISPEGNSALGWLDPLLMLGLWLFVWQTFGHRAAAMGLFLWAAPPLVFDYLSGSFLRWDWLFALGMAACFLRRGRHATAGAFLGYAVATKLFPLFFGVALLLREAFAFARTRRVSPGAWRFLLGAVAAGAACVLVAGAMFGFGAWAEYAQRIQVAQVEKFYSIQYSLKTVYLQVVAGNPTVWSHTLFPGELMQARADVDASQYALGFLLVRLAFTFLVAQLARRATEVEAFLLGPLLVFTWLTVNMYYWNMLGLLALGLFLRKDRSRPALGLLIALHVIFMFFYLYQHLNRGFTEGFAVAVLLAVAIAGAGLWAWRRPGEDPPAEPEGGDFGARLAL